MSQIIPELVTLITDGSWGQQKKCGGWSARVIYEGRRETFYGPVTSPCEQSYDAEIAAIGNGIAFGLKEGPAMHGLGWLVQTDNLRAVHILKTLRDPGVSRSVLEMRVRDYIVSLLDDGTLKYIVPRHIKAHVKEDLRHPRHHVHELMDKLAKRGRKEAEQQATGRRKESNAETK